MRKASLTQPTVMDATMRKASHTANCHGVDTTMRRTLELTSLAFLGDDATQIVHGPREQFDLIKMKYTLGKYASKC